ncbi:MAG: efflux RND transporter periplasmic adaptor subunit [Pseudomonadota bacterium]
MPSFLRLDSTVTTLGLAAVLALGVSALATYLPHNGGIAASNAAQVKPAKSEPKVVALAAKSEWEASAPGRVAPLGGEVDVRPETPGVVTKVYAKVGDVVKKGDLIAVMKDREAFTRVVAAAAEVEVRVSERDEEKESDKLLLAWRKAQDDLGAAERAHFKAQSTFDTLFIARRQGKASDRDVENARRLIEVARISIESRRKEVEEARAAEGFPLLSRLDSGLTIARTDLRLAELAYEKTRIRATSNGRVLQMEGVAGELATTNSQLPFAIVGDVSKLEVTAEVEERDISKIWVGQDVVVRANAFSGQDFIGKVTSIAAKVGSPALGLRGPSQPRDVEILEVDITLDGKPPLLPSMRVDVFFKPKGNVRAAAAAAKKNQ